jgi:hypothetical protein
MCPSAWAQEGTSQSTVAQALFEQARKLMDEGNYDSACPKFVESQRLDPATGTLLNLGLCYTKAGKTASAWDAFKQALASAQREDRADRAGYAHKQIAQLEPRLSTLTVVVPDDEHPDGMQVTVDGVDLGQPAWGAPIPMDPGKHVVRVTATGRRPWVTDVSLGEADRKVVTVAGLEPSTPGSAPSSPQPQPATHVQVEPSGGSATVGYVVGGAGVVALGVGGYFGLRAFSSWSDRNDHCAAGCDETAVTKAEDTNRFANYANVAVPLGLLGVGVGAYLVWFADGEEQRPTTLQVQPAVGRDGASLGVGGAF